MEDLGCRYLQFDEVWGFVGKKERHLITGDNPLRCAPAMAAGVERDFWTVEQSVEAVS